MFKALRKRYATWLEQRRCEHKFRYSRTKPGTLVCKLCRKRKTPEARVFH